VGLPCAACLLVLRLASAQDAAPPTAAPPTAAPTTAAPPTAVPPPPAADTHTDGDTDAHAPTPTRLALRDPFEFHAGRTGAVETSPVKAVSPDLIDPFERPAPALQSTRAADLRDPFVGGSVWRCVPELHGVPVQRPRGLERPRPACAAADRPLRNPFLPRPAPAGGPRSR